MPVPLEMDSKPRRNPDTAYRDVAEEGGLVVLPGRSEVKVLNPVGSRVFSLLDGEHTLARIIEVVTEEFDVDAARASEDVRSFIAELGEAGMLADAAATGEAEVPR